MAEAYSGLRRRRKRTHPSKCPCCISDHEVEPENEGSAGNEEHHEYKKEVKQTKRRRILKKKDSSNHSESDIFDQNLNNEKVDSNKPCLRNSIESSLHQDSATKKEVTKKVAKCVPSKKKDKNGARHSKGDKPSNTKNKTQKSNNNNNKGSSLNSAKKESKDSKKVNSSLLKSGEDCDSDEDISLSALKATRNKKSTSIDLDNKGKKTDKNAKEKGKEAIKRKNNSRTKKEKTESLSEEKDDGNTPLQNTKTKKRKTLKKVGGLTGRSKETISDVPSSKKIALDSSLQAVTKQRNSKIKNIVLSSKVSQVTQIKSKVFDQFHDKLRAGLGNKNLSVQEAAGMLVNISTESLCAFVRAGNSRNIDTSQQAARKGVLAQSRMRGISDTEETVSQAAEALVSFRSKSPLSRDDTNKTETTRQSVALNQETSKPNVLVNAGHERELQKTVPQMGASIFSSNQTVQALMQIQTSSSIMPQMFQTQLTNTAPPSQNWVQSQGFLPAGLSPPFPRGLQSAIATSLANLMPLVASHGTLPSFSQIAAHMRPSTLQGAVQSPLLGAGLTNHVVQPSNVMLPSQALLQPQLQTSVSNSGNSSKLQVLSTMKTTPASPMEGPATKSTGPKQILPQQPLKGMEEVVGNVGSNVPPMVWNVKSPVVFLGSPQNLGGVPRNLMATAGNQGVNVMATHEPSGYPPVAPRPVPQTDATKIGTRVNPGASSVPAVLTLGGRPILPRTQPRNPEENLSKRPQLIAPSNLFVPQQAALGSPGMFPVSSTTSSLPGEGVLTPVTLALNTKRTDLTTVNYPVVTSAQVASSVSNTGGACTSPTTVSAKQAVKKLVHERTKCAELKREALGNPQVSSRLKTILPSPPKYYEMTTVSSTALNDNPESAAKTEFNLEQAATALLSIGVPEGIEAVGLKSSSTENFKEEYDEDVVFTSKGMFRVGDVDVDPQYNSIGREGYTCGKCNKIFTSLSYLARHIKRVCPDMSCRKWKCSLCDKAFRHPFGLQQHVYTHTGERPHKCPICPKAFYSSNDLRRHSRIHSGERPYRCKHCDKTFATTISLKTHTYIHTGEKPHKCPQCPKTFATSSKLGRHIVTHSEQRPYSCEQCPKSFNRSGDLRRHNLAVHEGKEKTFDCDICAMTFSKSADLRRHYTNLHRKPHKMECEECGTQFSTPICLKMHRETYHKPSSTSTSDDKPCACDLCGKTYSSAAQLAKHRVTHEPTSTAGYDPSQFQHIAPKPVEPGGEPGSG